MRDYSGNKNPAYKFIDKDELIYFIEKGYSKTQISEHFNISYPCLNRKLNEYDIDWNDISTNTNIVICLVCNKKVQKINSAHLKKCSGLTTKQYKEKYPNIKITSEETCKKISNTIQEGYNSGRIVWNKGIKNCWNNNTIKKMRISRIKELEQKYGTIYPNYNLFSCQYFSFLNKAFGWNGQHAENGKEYHIKELGYFIDYYEPYLNLVIEYDEAHHYNSDGILKQKDKKRYEEIINKVQPNLFLRFEEKYMNYEPSLLSQFACGII